MKDEIKEILDNLIRYRYSDYECKQPEDCLTIEDVWLLLDYITNLQEKIKQYEDPEDLTLFYMWLDEKAKDKMKQLQEENERLKQNLSKGITNNLENKYLNNKLYKDLEDYKTRNEKAIEYIKKHCDYGYAGQKCLTDVLYRYEAEELLEILQGSDE